MVKTAETDDPIGIATVLNLSRHSTLGGLKELTQFILKQCPGKELPVKLEGVCSHPSETSAPACKGHLVRPPCHHRTNLHFEPSWNAGLAL